jgi:hypothetical protein
MEVSTVTVPIPYGIVSSPEMNIVTPTESCPPEDSPLHETTEGGCSASDLVESRSHRINNSKNQEEYDDDDNEDVGSSSCKLRPAGVNGSKLNHDDERLRGRCKMDG